MQTPLIRANTSKATRLRARICSSLGKPRSKNPTAKLSQTKNSRFRLFFCLITNQLSLAPSLGEHLTVNGAELVREQ